VRMLEETMIRATAEFGVQAVRENGKTGIWVRAANFAEKLAAIGVHISRWVTSHGFAYNVSTDLRFFDLIVPCGIVDCKPTSLENILERGVELNEVTPHLVKHFGEVFGLEMKPASREELLENLARAEQPVVLSA
jgi:lipoyl(octanoyl) transferase